MKDHFVYLSYHRENLTFFYHGKRQSSTIQSKVASAFKDLYRVLDLLLLEKFGTVFDSINSNDITIIYWYNYII